MCEDVRVRLCVYVCVVCVGVRVYVFVSEGLCMCVSENVRM